MKNGWLVQPSMNPMQVLLHPVFDQLGDVEDSDLHKAARDGNLDQMRSLLSVPHCTPLDINLKNCMGQTPLAQAAAGTKHFGIYLSISFTYLWYFDNLFHYELFFLFDSLLGDVYV